MNIFYYGKNNINQVLICYYCTLRQMYVKLISIHFLTRNVSNDTNAPPTLSKLTL